MKSEYLGIWKTAITVHMKVQNTVFAISEVEHATDMVPNGFISTTGNPSLTSTPDGGQMHPQLATLHFKKLSIF
jgi:hypothetical protein